MFMAPEKELYFFGPENEGPDTLEAYHDHFPFHDGVKYFGEATVMYYRHEEVARRIWDYNPKAKLLAIVRDPIERLRSQFQYHKQLGLVGENVSVDQVLDDEISMLVRDSHYEETLPAFTRVFGPEQFKIVSLEAGRDNPSTFWADLLDFLELADMPLPSLVDRPENPTGGALFRGLYRSTVRPIKNHFPGLYRWMLRRPTVRRVKRGLLQVLGTADSTSLPTNVRRQLREEFAPTYAYLQDLGFDVYQVPRAPEESPR